MSTSDPPLRVSKRRSNLALTHYADDDFRSGYRGNHFCNDKIVTPIKLAWYGQKKTNYSTTTFRLLPGKDPDDDTGRKWDRWRVSSNNQDKKGGMGDFIRSFNAWRRTGNPNVTFFLNDPFVDENYDKWGNPAFVLAMGAKKIAQSNGKHAGICAAMMSSKFGRAAVIKFPNRMFVAQGLLYEHGIDKDGNIVLHDPPLGIADGDKIPLFDLGADAGAGVVGLCEELVEGVEPEDVPLEADDWSPYYKIGDPVGMNAGVFFRAFPAEGTDPRERKPAFHPDRVEKKSYSTARRGGGGEDRRFGKSKEDKDKKGFEVFYQQEFNGFDAQLPKEISKSLRQRVRPWSEVLYFPDELEQARILAGSMRWKPPDDESRSAGELHLEVMEAIYGKEHPEWLQEIPDELWAEHRKRKTVSVPRVDSDGDVVDDEEEAAPRGRVSGPSGRANIPRQQIGGDEEDEDEEDEVSRPIPKKVTGKLDESLKRETIPDDDEDEDDDFDPLPDAGPAGRVKSRDTARSGSDPSGRVKSRDESKPVSPPKSASGKMSKLAALRAKRGG